MQDVYLTVKMDLDNSGTIKTAEQAKRFLEEVLGLNHQARSLGATIEVDIWRTDNARQEELMSRKRADFTPEDVAAWRATEPPHEDVVDDEYTSGHRNIFDD